MTTVTARDAGNGDLSDRELDELADRTAFLDTMLVDAALNPLRGLAPNRTNSIRPGGRRKFPAGHRACGLYAQLAHEILSSPDQPGVRAQHARRTPATIESRRLP